MTAARGPVPGEAAGQVSVLVVPSAQELGRAVRTDIACPVPRCGRALPNEPALRMHLDKAHGVREGPQPSDRPSRSSDGRPKLYCCPVQGCPRGPGRPFAQFSLVRQHYLKMHAERTHECGVCERRYSTRADLRRHQGDCGRVFSCSCGCPYASRTALLSHAYRTGHVLPEEHRVPPGRKRKLESQSSVQTPMRVVSVTQQPDVHAGDSTPTAQDMVAAPPQQKPGPAIDKSSPKTPDACPPAPIPSPARAAQQGPSIAAEQVRAAVAPRARGRCVEQHAVRAKVASSKPKCESDPLPTPPPPLAPSAPLRAPSKRLLLPKPSAVLLKLSVTQRGAAALLGHREGSSIKPVVVAVDEAGAIVSTLALVPGAFGGANAKGSKGVGAVLDLDGKHCLQPVSTVSNASPKAITCEAQTEVCINDIYGASNPYSSATNTYSHPLNFLVSANAQTDVSFTAVGSASNNVCTQTQHNPQRTTSSFAVQTESGQDQIQITKVTEKQLIPNVASWDPNGRNISLGPKLSGGTYDISTPCNAGIFVGDNNSTVLGLLKDPSMYNTLHAMAMLGQGLKLNQLSTLESVVCDRATAPENTNRDPSQMRAGCASGVDMETHTHDFELYLEQLLSGAALPSHSRDRGDHCIAPGTLDTSAQTDTSLVAPNSVAPDSTRVDGATQTSMMLVDDFNMEMFDSYTQTDLEVLLQDSSLEFPAVRAGFSGNCAELLDTQTQTDLGNFLEYASRLPESQMTFACNSALNTETQTDLFLQRGSSMACPDSIDLKGEMLAHPSMMRADVRRDSSFSTDDSAGDNALRLDFTSSCVPLHIQTQTEPGAPQEQVASIPELDTPVMNFAAESGSLPGETRAGGSSRAPLSSAETQTPRNDLDDFFFTSIETQTMEDDFLLSDLDFGGMETPFGSIDAQTSPGYGSSAESEESHAGSRAGAKADVPSIFQHFHF
ncbi:ATM interactor isoform X1 [Lampetra fluviatilis]